MTCSAGAAAIRDQHIADLWAALQDGTDQPVCQRDEFNFSVGIQFGGIPLDDLRATLAMLTREQRERSMGGTKAAA
ncbi:hypothetical protein OG241_09145 [Streptomyces sp. NBC_01390]|uniref:hypothetical protein n=1 Tax=unclassified Streptomyces TaxID=2593676 RepID=UPI00324EDF0B